MDGLKRAVMWLGLMLIITLTVLSVYGTFVGAEHARILFNTPAMQIFWILLTITLVMSLIIFPTLIKRPSLLLAHMGCILILAGPIWSSATGHQIQKELFRSYEPGIGRMLIYEGQKTNEVVLPGYSGIYELPFDIALEDFRIEYYDSNASGQGRMPKDFLSDLRIIRDGKTVLEKTIEVNHPLHYGGYYFYQYSYDDQADRYTILAVVSDKGIFIVFTGYMLLTAGLFGCCWFAPAIRRLRKK
ncbi:MAG: cytochrome c biogenesis protein ResB [Phycisphaerae bacterium]